MTAHKAHHILAPDLIEDIEVTDDGMLQWMLTEGRALHEMLEHVLRVIISHRKLASDHFLFLDEFVRMEVRRTCHVRNDVEIAIHIFRDTIDPINRAIEGRVSIHIAAH